MSNEIKINIYNPTDERMCRGCYQKFETQEGILDSGYKFTCPPCNKFYKYQDWATFVLVPTIVPTIIVLLFLLIIRFAKKDLEKKENEKNHE